MQLPRSCFVALCYVAIALAWSHQAHEIQQRLYRESFPSSSRMRTEYTGSGSKYVSSAGYDTTAYPGQSSALSALYSATSGPSWYNSTGWMPASPNYCDWFGVVCTPSGDVRELNLAANNLQGILPPSLSILASSLQRLHFFDNALSGTLPAVLSTLTGLTELHLSTNSMTGSLPSFLGTMTNLKVLFVSGNYFTGSIPTNFAQLTNLEELFVSSNSLSGSLPLLSPLTLLTTLDIAVNNFEGTLPAWLGQLSSLQFLYSSFNKFTGSVPAEWSALSQFRGLFLASNAITGNVPSFLSTIQTMQYISMSGNALEGSLGEWMTNMSSLISIDVGDNFMSGPLPHHLPQSLQFVALNQNYFTGSIPQSFGDVRSMQTCVLSGNALTGYIPQSLSGLTSLAFMSISDNYIQGTFPGFLLLLPNLLVLDISRNMMTGNIATFTDLNFDQSPHIAVMDISHNAWEGEFSGIAFATSLCPTITVFQADGCGFSGGIPSAVAACNTLVQLSLWNNSFTGSIPSVYGTLPLLGTLILDETDMSTPCNVTNNILDANNCLSSFLIIDPQEMVASIGQDYACASITGTTRLRTVTLDPSYLNYAHCICRDGFFRNPTNPGVCTPCVGWCTCTNNQMTNCYPSPAADTAIYALPCPLLTANSTACNPNSNGTGSCAQGYTDRLCSRCEPGYYRSGRECSLCEPYMAVAIPILYTVLFAVLIVYLLIIPPRSLSLLKTATFYFQSLLVLVRSGNVLWPREASDLLARTSFAASFSPAAVECVFPTLTHVGINWLYLSLPAILCTACGIIYLLGRVVAAVRAKPLHATWGERCACVALYFLQLTFFNITIVVLNGFSCTVSDPGLNQQFLNFHPWLPCDVNNVVYRQMLIACIMGLLVYVMGVPLALLITLKRSDLTSTRVVNVFGFLYSNFKARAYWFETWMIARRFLLALVFTMVPFTSPSVNMIATVSVLQAAIIVQHSVKPFVTHLENNMELVSLYVLFFSYVGAFGIFVAASSATEAVAIGSLTWILFTANILFALVLIVLLITVFVTSVMLKLGARFNSRRRLRSMFEHAFRIRSVLLQEDDDRGSTHLAQGPKLEGLHAKLLEPDADHL